MRKEKHNMKEKKAIKEEASAKALPELAAKEKEAEEYKDKWMRTLAEYDNLKKRFEKEKLEFLRFSNEQILLQLLPIIDDFDRAHDAAKNHKHGEVFSKGVEMILNQFHKLLSDNGVEKIKTVGERFDPHVHEAITIVETEKDPDDVVAEEVSPGYTMNGRLLRAAKVKIYHNDKRSEVVEQKDHNVKEQEGEKND